MERNDVRTAAAIAAIGAVVFLLFFGPLMTMLSEILSLGHRTPSVSERDFNRVVYRDTANGTEKYTVRHTEDTTKYLQQVRGRTEILNSIHCMANTLIVADQIWGRLMITNRRLNGLLIEVSLSGLHPYEKENLRNILTRWKRGDFSQAVHDHN